MFSRYRERDDPRQNFVTIVTSFWPRLRPLSPLLAAVRSRAPGQPCQKNVTIVTQLWQEPVMADCSLLAAIRHGRRAGAPVASIWRAVLGMAAALAISSSLFSSRLLATGDAVTARVEGEPRSATAATTTAAPRVLHVTADPNNLPFSNDKLEGFENKIVDLIARELGAKVEYTWWAQRRGWFRNTLKEGSCDLVPGVPWHFDRALTTAPYYRSTYALVYRTDRNLNLRSLDDPALRRLRIGVQMIGDDFANTPPAHALSRRGIIDNVRGYTVYGDYTEPNPPSRIVDAVARGEVDVAVVWGPLAGYFAKQHRELTVVPLPPLDIASGQPFAFDISVGVRKSEPALRNEINAILARRKTEIDAILAEYGVPVLTETKTAATP